MGTYPCTRPDPCLDRVERLETLFRQVESSIDIVLDRIGATESSIGAVNSTLVKVTRTATLVVAANDSSDKSKAQADYVCPEDDALDYITSTVIPALPANGGSIVLLEGTYTVSTDDEPLEINTKTNIAIIGQGAGTKLCLATGIASDLIKVIDSSEILIENLLIDGTTTSAGGRDGILFENVDHSKVSKVWSLNNKNSGMFLTLGSDYNEIVQSEFRGNTDASGIGLDGSTTNNTKNLIVGNVCSGNYDGIYLVLSTDNIITGNLLLENVDDCGIYLDSDSHRNAIVGNTVQGNAYGIYVDTGCDHNTVTGNIVQGNDSNGIYLGGGYYNSALGNTVSGNDMGIASIGGSHSNITGNTVQGNTAKGIDVNADYNTITGNICQGNAEEGIYVISCSHSTISGNLCHGNDRDGIEITSSSHNNVIGNTCYDNGKGAAATYDGIYIANNSDYNSVQTNLVRKGAGNTHCHGIRVDDNTCDDNLIANNDAYDGGGTNGISDAGTNTLFGSGNRNKDGTWGVVPN